MKKFFIVVCLLMMTAVFTSCDKKEAVVETDPTAINVGNTLTSASKKSEESLSLSKNTSVEPWARELKKAHVAVVTLYEERAKIKNKNSARYIQVNTQYQAAYLKLRTLVTDEVRALAAQAEESKIAQKAVAELDSHI